MNLSNFTGYALAGGKSSRMGADKAFLKIRGKTFIENAVGILKTNCRQVKIVLNKSQTHFIKKLPAGSSHVFDIYENRGALGGIHAALKNCQSEFAVILAVDLPFVTGEAIAKLCEMAINSKDLAAIVPRQRDGKMQPLAAVYRAKKCLSKLEEILSKTESASARRFLETLEIKIVEETVLSLSDDLFANINSPQDLEKL